MKNESKPSCAVCDASGSKMPCFITIECDLHGNSDYKPYIICTLCANNFIGNVHRGVDDLRQRHNIIATKKL